MPNFKPWSDANEDTSFERGAPVTQAAKSVTNAVSDQAATHGKAIGNTLLDWLYGTDSANADPQGDDAAKQAAQQGQPASAQQAAAATAANATKSPEEQANLEKVRQELFAKNNSGQFGVEPEMQKARQERMQREKEREEIEQQEKEAAAAAQSQMSELPMPQGKRTGMQPGKPNREQQMESPEIAKARTAAEANRGTTG